MDPALADLDASALSEHIQRRKVSCREVMQSTIDRIHAVNPAFNALVNIAPEDSLLSWADAADVELAAGRSRGWLHGIPVAAKDVTDALGFPTTRGSPLLTGAMPHRDSVMVARMKAAGALIIGKTNVPEFGLGSHTFNEVFGATRNAWDPAVSAGGSSGGAAVALAQRILTVADGSDFMGSLRNPAGWNHVYGMRPTQGRVPSGPGTDVWIDQLATEGPMARSATDLGRLLMTQSGYDPRLPLSIEGPLDWTPAITPPPLRGIRIGWLADVGGYLPMEDGVLAVCEEALRHFEDARAVVEPVPLGMDPAQVWQCWLVWRRALVGARIEPLLDLPDARARIKPEAMWEYEASRGLTFADFMRASQFRTRFLHHMLELFTRYDVLALPSAQVWPFPVTDRWPAVIDGRPMDTYHRWMEVVIYATLAGLPAISIPAGFHATRGWPMGLQLIATHGADSQLLRIAQGYEAERPAFIARRPPL